MQYTIIGAGAAAMGAIRGIREVDPHGAIAVISEEPYLPYSRPLISEYLASKLDEEQLMYYPPDFYAKQNVNLIVGTRVVEIDWKNKLVNLESTSASEKSLAFDRLLICTGTKPTKPILSGSELEGVTTFTNLDDAKVIKRLANKGTKAVVLGGGLIGLKAAVALSQIGARVTIVVRSYLLRAVLDKEASNFAAKQLLANGIDIISGCTAAELKSRNGRVAAVALTDGRELDCDVVIIATGVTPNLSLVMSHPVIKIGKGLMVNQWMQTSLSDVFAAGDVVESWDVALETSTVNVNWPNAYRQGYVAGRNMAGAATPYKGGLAMTSFAIFGLPFISVGIVSDNPGSEYEVRALRSRGDSLYRKLVFKDNRLKGALLVGDTSDAGVFLDLIKTQAFVGVVKDSIVDARYQWYRYYREKVKDQMEGRNIQWKESHSSQEPYRKRFDEARWAARERGEL